jgi:ribosome maturation factor RimP
MSDSPVVGRVTALVLPILADLELDLYDCEFGGGVLKITVDTPPGSPGGVDLDTLSLATRLISRELDHDDPVPGHYTLEVTSPGLERSLRRPEHFQREVGKVVAVRLRDVVSGERRLQGRLAEATSDDITLALDGGGERRIAYAQIDRARTVFVWGPAPKPGKKQPGPKQRGAAARPSTKEAPAT